MFILPVISCTFLWNIPRFNELKTCYMVNNSEIMNMSDCMNTTNTSSGTILECKLSVCPTQMRKNMSYIRDYILIGNFLIMVLLPFLLLSILNSRIYYFISKNKATTTSIRQRRDHRIALMLIIIVSVFGCCNIPRVAINLYEVSLLQEIVVTVIQVLKLAYYTKKWSKSSFLWWGVGVVWKPNLMTTPRPNSAVNLKFWMGGTRVRWGEIRA